MAQQTHSGLERLIFLFRERVVSDDLNRLQQFIGFTLADLFRRMHTSSAIEEEAAGKTTVASATASPLRAMIFEGIRFRPEIGTINAFVEPGVLLTVFPEVSPHPADSVARLIHDAGVQSAGSLVLTAGGGGTRIDVVECQPTETVTEADSRDIFNPATGLFAPSVINKVAKGSLTYRIRTGTAGAGWPGTASGWLPIAVCSVPAAAASWDVVTVWDVRPLLADLARPPHLIEAKFPGVVRSMGSAIDIGAGDRRLRGIFEGEFLGWKVGGDLAPTESGVDYLSVSSGSVLEEPGFAAAASRPWYLYLMQPFGLPRWAQYTPASVGGERRPRSPRGIPVLTQKAPAGLSGVAGSAIALPTATGLGGSGTAGIVAFAFGYGTAASWCGGCIGGDGWTTLSEPAIAVAPTSGTGTSDVLYNLTSTEVPPHASAIRVRFTTSYADNVGDTSFNRRVDMRDAAAGNVVFTRRRSSTESVPAAGAFVDICEFDLELPPNLPNNAATTRQIRFLLTVTSLGAQVFSSQSMLVIGWRLGS